MTIARYRKKPVEIEAVRVVDTLKAAKHEWNSLPSWLATAYETGHVLFLDNAVSIVTLEGAMRAERDDWIIRGVQGELYPCKPDIFRATYEAVDEDEHTGPLVPPALRAAFRQGDAEAERTLAILAGPEAEQYRAALSEAMRLGNGAPWSAIRDRASELAATEQRAAHDDAELRRIRRDSLTRAEQAEAGRLAADNMLRAVCEVFGGPHQDPIVKARETLARAERAEAAIERVRSLVAGIAHPTSAGISDYDLGRHEMATAVVVALTDQPAPDQSEAATEATDTEIARAALTEVYWPMADLDHPQHPANAAPRRFTAAPRDPEAEQAAEERAREMADQHEKTARVFAALHRSAEGTVTRVIDLYEQWVKAGPPPLGTSVYRWWDARLAELHNAIQPPADQATEK
ncbi:hypothetical protein [Streptomyces sp. L2]|uniref:hypothetical protein n=1 Tax=Streptomyces sp. L2 TaxID=2162665 RepID=UPI0019D6EEE4|nr:hypothetical protein [Streptomyces sp. L2]